MTEDVNFRMKEDYETGLSMGEIAKKYKRSQTTVHRIFKKMGVHIRSASEAQKLALATGRSKNPTAGVGHSVEAKVAMSDKAANRWARMTDADRDKFKAAAKERWSKLSDFDKKEMLRLAGVALRRVATEGSEIEQYLEGALIKEGFVVLKHVKNFMGGEYEIDLLLKDEGIAIELDGPHHFLPIFGEERLEKTMRFDAAKNGSLIGMGLTIVRVKCMYKNLTEKMKRDTLSLIVESVRKIRAGEVTSKLVEVELSNGKED
jgi:very-short-patch-repair endonuclease